jgi:hypothetical protein
MNTNKHESNATASQMRPLTTKPFGVSAGASNLSVAPTAQNKIAQGNALGLEVKKNTSPERA